MRWEFHPLFDRDRDGLTEDLGQHGRQIALAFTTTARIAGLPLEKLTFDWGMFVSDLAVSCFGPVIRLNFLAGHC